MKLRANSRFIRGAIAFLVVLLTSFWITTSFAQEVIPSKKAQLTLNFLQQGTADVTFYLNFQPPSNLPIEKSLSEALGCQLQDSKIITSKTTSLIRGKCDKGFSQAYVAGEFKPNSLVKILQPLDVKNLRVRIYHSTLGFAHSYNGKVINNRFASYVYYSYKLDGKTRELPPLSYQFGYNFLDLVRIFAPLVAVLILPIVLTLWLQRSALAGKQEPTAVWFGYVRALNWIIIGIWILWFTFLYASKAEQLIELILGDQFALPKEALGLSFAFLPPTIVTVICYALSHPVFAHLRGMSWTRGDLIQQAIWSQAGRILPIILFFQGLYSLIKSNFQLGVILLVAAYVCRLVCLRQLMKVQDLTFHALTVGELRDRIFSMAENAHVKLQQIYIFPAGKGQMINAFARQGNSILLSDYLLEKLSKREVDAIVGHELGHLKHNHPSKLIIVFAGAIFIYSFLVGFLYTFLPWLAPSPVMLILTLLTFYLFSQHFERTADAEAVALSGDPEAAISGLVKLTRLNWQPLESGKWLSKLSTHPSTMQRVKNIANRSQISSERLSEIISQTDVDTQYYSLPSAITTQEKIFSTKFKTQVLFGISWTVVAVKIFTPALAAYLGEWEKIPESQKRLIYLVGFFATIALYLVTVNFLAIMGWSELPQKLRKKLKSEGIEVERLGGIFVSFSPAAEPRIYEGFTNWDIGFLFLFNGHLCYIGEQTRFSLRPEQVTEIRLGAGFPGWFSTPLIYLNWQDESHLSAGTFNLQPVEVRSLTYSPT